MLEKQKKEVNDSLTNIRKVISAMGAVAKQDSMTYALQMEKLVGTSASLTAELARIEMLSRSVVDRKKKSDWSLNLGLTGSPSVNLNAKHTKLVSTYTFAGLQGGEVEIDKDTVINEEQKGKLTLPMALGFGISLKQSTRWLVGADFSLQDWSKYSLFTENDNLQNSWRTAAGLQWTPDDRGNKSYFHTIQYRLGVHYEQTHLQLRESRLNDIGASIGFGFPARRGVVAFQLAVEAGRRGTVTNNLVEVNYVKCMFAFTLNDRWFIKPRID
jgi:hypothetical protein